MPLAVIIAFVFGLWLLSAYLEFRMWRQIGRLVRSWIHRTPPSIG